MEFYLYRWHQSGGITDFPSTASDVAAGGIMRSAIAPHGGLSPAVLEPAGRASKLVN